MNTRIPVSFVYCNSYDAVEQAVDRAFSLVGYSPQRGDRVLVKPNLLLANSLTCTHPSMVRAACYWLLGHGVKVSVGDSPAFGSAPGVARAIGLTQALATLPGSPLPLFTLDNPVSCDVPGLGSIGISRHALEADSILCLPRVKAHAQMRMTGAVKNLFGCVCGVRKAIAHAKHGDKGDNFPQYLASLLTLLPSQTALVDGIVAMHKKGPTRGETYPLHLVAASPSCVGVDTAIFSLLNLHAEQIPLWNTLQRNRVAGAYLEDITLHGDPVESFDATAFEVPATLMRESFHPGRLCISTLRRFWARIWG